ncbi:uncharacterized protein CTRU02_209658 [Colletotrichum truncatum]|uniref:Uncharacterized protein n=1 Tax=Colletotrichum truncatum TaxID=5467 RepID=A0ACC3YT64_COLTU|nr:uncharacterized protein CTRU02_12041 [Colletotrichum truncatum]KAF6785109.1 hypothetical protein CTRU02_12041 [Colletotrichum truncatum]
MAEDMRTRNLPQRCQHHSSIFRKNEHLIQSQSYNINDVAITLTESITGQMQWTAREKPLKDTVARILSKQGAETNPKIVSASTIFSLMKSIDDLCLLGLLFPTTQLNHVSHPVFLEVGQARGRVGWTQSLQAKAGPRTSHSILIRLSTTRYYGDDKREALSLKEVIQVAIHEMIHAYLLLLSCRQRQCGVEFDTMHRDSDGSGHGLAFVALLKAVLGQVQSWAPQLKEFGMTDEAIDPYEDFSLRLWKRGEGISARTKEQRVWWLAARPL